MLDIELSHVRDGNGKRVTDRFRVLLDRRGDKPKFVVLSIDESKCASRAKKIMGRLGRGGPRILAGLATALHDVGNGVAFDRASVSFGPEFVLASLSERPAPVAMPKVWRPGSPPDWPRSG